MSRSSKGGWLLYCMVPIPFIWWIKIGITSLDIGALKRAFAIDKAIDKSLWWLPFPTFVVPIMVTPVPGAYNIEQALHGMFRHENISWYKGDGHTEFFWLTAAFRAIPIMLSINALYLAGIDAIFHTKILPTVAKMFFDALFWVGEYLMSKI